MRSLRCLALAGLLPAALVAPAHATDADLVPRASEFQVFTGNFQRSSTDSFLRNSVIDKCVPTGNHRVLRFNFDAQNIGTEDFNAGRPIDHPDLFVFDPGHGHFHFIDFNRYTLGANKASKQSFCLRDSLHEDPFAGPSHFPDCDAKGLTAAGVTAGYADRYSFNTGCQFIVIDGLADGVYSFTATTNALKKVPERDFSNNALSFRIRLRGNKAIPLLPKRLVALGDGRVLEWDTGTGHFRIWTFNPSATGTADPLPTLVDSGKWASIQNGHDLIPLANSRVLDWEIASGINKVWIYDASVTSGDPLGDLDAKGSWFSIRSGHKLIPLDTDRLLDWVPATGAFRVWHYDNSLTGTVDVLPGAPVASGTWSSIKTGHTLVPLGGGRVLDWEPKTGHRRIWAFDRNATGDPFPGKPVNEGTWSSILTGHELIPVTADRVIDWEPATGNYRVWRYDPTITGAGDPFPGAPVTKGTWRTIIAPK
jgi:hypothetical protein